ncbi:MAG: hypothetical protein WBB70_12665 [Desulfobacterales bacterium]
MNQKINLRSERKGYMYPHARFSKVFENITSAIPENGSVLITLKEGIGDLTGSDGRTFYLWQDKKARELFNSWGSRCVTFQRLFPKQDPGMYG